MTARCSDPGGLPYYLQIACVTIAYVPSLRACAGRRAVKRYTVEPLPAHPSLEHQQKLAKRLLRDVWAGDADAIARVLAFLPGKPNLDALKLHDVQVVIARGYGFSSWAAMKLKIDSLTKSPLEQFDIAVREGDAKRAGELLAKHAALRHSIHTRR